MANTKTTTTMFTSDRKTVIHFTLVSDGTQETNTVVYSSSGNATTNNKVDPKNCQLLDIRYSAASSAGIVKLNWDASTPVLALSMPYGGKDCHFCYEKFGGLKNQGGAGITGNIVLTTTGLASGDSLSLTLEIRPAYTS